MNVLVVGAGIAGQTLGCALARRRIDCELVELKTEFDVIGAGMYVQANALRAFDDIGVVPAIRRAGWQMPDDCTDVAGADGKVVASIRYLRIAGPDVPVMVPIQRRALHDVLAAAVQANGVPVRMGVSVDSLRDDGKAVEARFTDGRSGRYDLVIGADGIRSKVRQLTFPDAAPSYSGFSNWRVILPRPPELQRPTWCFGRGKSVGIVPLSKDSLYIAGVSKEPGNPRFPVDRLHELCRSRFQEFSGLPGRLLAQVTRAEQVVYTGIEQVALPRPWYRGRVVILGDAAHASTPFWSQGAAMAVEDAVLLARLLEAGNDVNGVLAAWMERRYERCRFVQEGSLSTGQRSHGEDHGASEAVLDYARTRMQADVTQRYTKLSEAI